MKILNLRTIAAVLLTTVLAGHSHSQTITLPPELPAAVQPDPAAAKAKAQALQNYGLPSQVYLQDPTGLDEKQSVAQLYSFDAQKATPFGEALLETLDQASPQQVSRITKKKLYMLMKTVRDYSLKAKDPRYAPHPELLASYKQQIKDVLAKDIPGDTDWAGLGKSEKTLGQVLQSRQEVLAKAIAALEKSPDAAKDSEKLEVMKRVHGEMNTLRFEADGKPLIPSTLYYFITSIPEKDLTQDQWRTLIESYPMGKTIWADRIDRLWRNKLDGRGVTIAIIDTGADKNHPYLKGAVSDFGNLTNHRYADHNHKDKAGKDLFGTPDNRGLHGTAMASIITDSAPKAKILNIKALDEEAREQMPPELIHDLPTTMSSISNALKKIYFHNKSVFTGEAKNKIDIVSMSLGIPGGNTAAFERLYSDQISTWVSKLAKQGVLVVIAAGNEGTNTLGRPGVVPEALTVGAVDYFKRITDFSGNKLVVDVEKKMVAGKPEIHAYGSGVPMAKYDPAGYYDSKGTTDLAMVSNGSSPATAHVAALSALLLQAGRSFNVELTPDQIKQLITDTSTLTANGNPYAGNVSGLADPNKALELLIKKYKNIRHVLP